MRSRVSAVLAVILAVIASPSFAQDVAEPQTGVKFAAKSGEMSLLGVGLRVKKFVFIPVKVYALGLYVSDAALSGPLTSHKGKTAAPEFYKELVNGDFTKEVQLKFVRDVGRGRIQNAMREALAGADKAKTEAFVAYFPEVKEGQTCVLRWGAGGVLETTMAGQAKPPIPGFAASVFGIWLGDKPIQEDIKKDLAARAPELIK